MIRNAVMILGVLVSSSALAETYHVGGDCAPLPAYQAPGYIAANADTARPVDVNPNPMTKDLENVAIGLNIPLNTYIAPGTVNADLSRTDIAVGQIGVNTKTGSTTFNGREIAAQAQYPADCGLSGKSIYSTK
jgi:hypothetical protein